MAGYDHAVCTHTHNQRHDRERVEGEIATHHRVGGSKSCCIYGGHPTTIFEAKGFRLLAAGDGKSVGLVRQHYLPSLSCWPPRFGFTEAIGRLSLGVVRRLKAAVPLKSQCALRDWNGTCCKINLIHDAIKGINDGYPVHRDGQVHG